MQIKVSKRHHLQEVNIQLSGAKNALLHLLFASLLTEDTTTLTNVPSSLRDYHAVCDILLAIGARVDSMDGIVAITAPQKISQIDVSSSYTRRTRTSLMLLGALAKKVGILSIGHPGGCSFSEQRPFDIHLHGFEALGARVTYDDYHITIEHIVDKEVEHTLRYPSVGASINLMLYAVLGSTEVTLHNIALEPEVIEVASFLNYAGAQIKIDHHQRIMSIKGVERLSGVNFRVMYDRIQTMTYAALAYLHQLDVCVEGVNTKEYIAKPLQVLKEMGAKWRFEPDKNRIYFQGRKSVLKPTRITAMPYPEFATDLQPVFAIMCVKAQGVSEITDTVYPERIKYVDELRKLNFPIEYHQGKIRIFGGEPHTLHAATMKSYDLRAGMAVVMGASLSDQVCTISSAEQIFRGYENLLENMTHFMHISIDTGE